MCPAPLLKEGILSPTPLSECGNFCLSNADFSVSLGRRQKCLREEISFDLMARLRKLSRLVADGGRFGREVTIFKSFPGNCEKFSEGGCLLLLELI
ncbi:hypothetical protein CDAR_164181 [Caerostris darwini]|uniref:Uncharacterized protein n=1 Tax=Caerostris darwini TaxID=1538125 RepID=A0AAV4X758_9ARAC|nr:hypothetical protein CDAR_164181 [Caerostris darwini]